MSTNPLLQTDKLPAFNAIRTEHIEPAIDQVLAENRAGIQTLLRADRSYTWDTVIQPLEELEDRLNRVWSPVSHLHAVADNEDLREAYNACMSKLSDYNTDLGQNRDLYEAYKTVGESEEYAELSPAQQRIIDHALRDFRLSGIDLNEEGKKRYREIRQSLTRLETRFEENLLDATHAWKKHITDESLLAGLPESVMALARQTAGREGLEGWLFTLEFPSYMPVMQYANNRALREEMYRAYVSRASDINREQTQWDNSTVMEEIIGLRQQLAELLGFRSYAHYSLARKMAKEPDEVISFLTDLAGRSRPVAKQDLQELEQFARENHATEKPEAWDIAYFSEKLRQHKYALSQEELRPYFPVPRVISGLFAVVNKLYGLTITQRHNIETWHEDVQFFDIHAEDGSLRGSFYLDLYARKNKRGGAWMDECVVRKKTATGIQTPVAYLTCNFTTPVGNEPSLLTHDEVTTLFHEFGHGLHHMLTKVDYAGVSGINGVPWDAVELPSQFMENWCWERESLDLIGRHYKTGETINAGLFDRLIASRNFQSGMQMVRQLEFALFDFRLHLKYQTATSAEIQALIDQVREEVAVIKPPDFNRFQHSFSHIFAGGYAAGYYSYKWAEVLSADAFSKFEETGIFNRQTGNEFLHSILEQGGSRDPMDLFQEFRGRKPSIEPLLRHSGIAV